MKIIVDCTNNTETTKELTQKEISDKMLAKQQLLDGFADREAKETARAAILDRLGLTADEAALLLS